MASPWRFFLAHSYDPTSRICELSSSKSRQLTVELLKTGSFSCVCPLTSDEANYAAPWTTCVVAERLDQPLWSGPITNIRGQLASKQVTLTASGWMELLNRRILRARQVFYLVDAGLIAQQLVAYVNGIRDTGIYCTYVETTQPRSLTYEIGTFVGPLITALAELEDGFDFTIDPITKELRIFAKKMAFREDTVFSIGAPPHNLADCEVVEDGTTLCNFELGKGAIPWAQAEDDDSIGAFGEFDDFVSLSDVNNPDVLLAYVGVDVAIRSSPRLTFNVTPFTWSSDNAVPGFAIDYDLGDVVYVTCVGGRYNFRKQAQRVYSVSFSIDDEGNEKVTGLKTTPS